MVSLIEECSEEDSRKSGTRVFVEVLLVLKQRQIKEPMCLCGSIVKKEELTYLGLFGGKRR